MSLTFILSNFYFKAFSEATVGFTILFIFIKRNLVISMCVCISHLFVTSRVKLTVSIDWKLYLTSLCISIVYTYFEPHKYVIHDFKTGVVWEIILTRHKAFTCYLGCYWFCSTKATFSSNVHKYILYALLSVVRRHFAKLS